MGIAAVQVLQSQQPPSSSGLQNENVYSGAGVWATLQFKFLQLQYPPVALSFERLLLAAALPLGAAVQTWGVVAAVGASAAAYYLAVLLALMYYALMLPLPSSFYKKEAGRAIGEDVCVCCLSLVLLLPSSFLLKEAGRMIGASRRCPSAVRRRNSMTRFMYPGCNASVKAT